MKSPITGKEMKLVREFKLLEFRKSNFKVVYQYYQCSDSGENFTTTHLDELNLCQVYHQYRVKFGIPFPDEIIRIREQYGVSAAKMSEILGFGVNGYRNYESGEMPSVSNAKLIHMAYNPDNFRDMVNSCDFLPVKERSKLETRIEFVINDREIRSSEYKLVEYLIGDEIPDIYSGFKTPNMEKFAEMVVYFSDTMKPFKTRLNKFLFYADFLNFKKSCQSISGVRYKAINMGPVPNNFNSIYEYLCNKNDIEIKYMEFPKGYSGEQFVTAKNRILNPNIFSTSELEVLQEVVSRFSGKSTSEIIEISHLEEAWLKNHTDKSLISYEHAFEID